MKRAERTMMKFPLVGLVVGAIVLAPASALADFTALTSADQIIGTTFDFDALAVGFIDSGTNAITSAAGFIFPDVGLPGMTGEFIASDAEGGHVLDVLGGTLGFDGLVQFEFLAPVGAVGISYDTATRLSLVAFDADGVMINLDGSILSELNAEGGAANAGFFGISSDIGITTLMIHDSAGTFQLDNLIWGTRGGSVMPVPPAISLAAIGMGLVGWWRRRN